MPQSTKRLPEPHSALHGISLWRVPIFTIYGGKMESFVVMTLTADSVRKLDEIGSNFQEFLCGFWNAQKRGISLKYQV